MVSSSPCPTRLTLEYIIIGKDSPVLDGANVVEQGAPSELMARAGPFVRLFDTSSTTNAPES